MWFCAVRSAELATPGHVPEGAGRPGERAAGPRPRRAAAGVPQRLPPPRRAAVHRGRGRAAAQPALPVPRLDLRPRRQARRRAEHRDADRRRRRADRPLPVRPRPRRADRMARLRVGVPVRHPAAVRATSSPRPPRALGDADAIDRYGIGGLDVGRRDRLRRGGELEADRRELHGVLPLRSIHPELVGVLPEFATGMAAQANIGHGAEFGSAVDGFTVDGARRASSGCRASPRGRTAATSRSRSSRRCSSTWCPTTSSSTG